MLNINSLANALKPAFLPGETLQVAVIQEGKEPGQGVGFLDDGTMIVVEGGGRLHGPGGGRHGHAGPPDGRRAGWSSPSRGRSERASSRRGSPPTPSRRRRGRRAADGRPRQAGRAPIVGRPLLAWTLDGAAASERGSSGRRTVGRGPRPTARHRGCPPSAWIACAGGATVVARRWPRRRGVALEPPAGRRSTERAIILVHDGARPLVSPALVDAVAEAARRARRRRAVRAVGETLKRVDGGRRRRDVEHRPRDLAAAQTPQGARAACCAGVRVPGPTGPRP